VVGGFAPFGMLREPTHHHPNPYFCRALWVNALDGAREGDGLADMFDTTDPGDGTFNPHTKATMWNAAELAQVKIPAIGLFRQAVLMDALEQQVVAGHAFRTADDLAIAFGASKSTDLQTSGRSGQGSM